MWRGIPARSAWKASPGSGVGWMSSKEKSAPTNIWTYLIDVSHLTEVLLVCFHFGICSFVSISVLLRMLPRESNRQKWETWANNWRGGLPAGYSSSSGSVGSGSVGLFMLSCILISPRRFVLLSRAVSFSPAEEGWGSCQTSGADGRSRSRCLLVPQRGHGAIYSCQPEHRE